MNEDSPDYIATLKKIAREAGEKARQQAFDAGLSVMIMEDGILYKEYKDGTKRKVK